MPSDTTAGVVAWLHRPQAWPQPTQRVSVQETHMSWIFLTDRYAYKLKKPVRHPYLDFSTVAAREFNCLEEVRLNARLAPGVYLDVVPVMLEADGAIRLRGTGAVVDWLVQMRRLPAERELRQALRAGTADPASVREAAIRLANFYRESPPAETSGEAWRHRLESAVRTTRDDLLEPAFHLPAADILRVSEEQLQFIARNSQRLDERVRGGHVVEGHGDLRPEHVYLTRPPVFIDCLEFNRELRIVDTADELAFLSLECAMLGNGWVGALFETSYAEVTGDVIPRDVSRFHASMRAMLRARLAARHTREATYRRDPRWLGKARRYLGYAARCLTVLAHA